MRFPRHLFAHLGDKIPRRTFTPVKPTGEFTPILMLGICSVEMIFTNTHFYPSENPRSTLPFGDHFHSKDVQAGNIHKTVEKLCKNLCTPAAKVANCAQHSMSKSSLRRELCKRRFHCSSSERKYCDANTKLHLSNSSEEAHASLLLLTHRRNLPQITQCDEREARFTGDCSIKYRIVAPETNIRNKDIFRPLRKAPHSIYIRAREGDFSPSSSHLSINVVFRFAESPERITKDAELLSTQRGKTCGKQIVENLYLRQSARGAQTSLTKKTQALPAFTLRIPTSTPHHRRTDSQKPNLALVSAPEQHFSGRKTPNGQFIVHLSFVRTKIRAKKEDTKTQNRRPSERRTPTQLG